MSVQAPAITGVNTPGMGVAPGFASWLRGIGVRQVRLACRLVFSITRSAMFPMRRWKSGSRFTSGGGGFRSSTPRFTAQPRSIFRSAYGRSISAAGIALDSLKRQRVEIRGRLESMTVLTTEDPTVLAGWINPQGQTTEAELEVA
jgi:hypothetical protein